MHATLCDLMTDLVQNSVEADATEIQLILRQENGQIEFEVHDNGNGMNRETQAKAIDPFYSDGRKHAHRRVGLGLPFLFQTADAAGGRAAIESEEGRGTVVRFCAPSGHVDLPPEGDFAGAAAMMMTMPAGGELRIVRSFNGREYSLSRTELAEAIGGLGSSGELNLLRTFIASQEEDLRKAG
jgi:hypothetical protein